MDVLNWILKSPLWSVLNTVALIITLFYIIRYTKATTSMAKASNSMVNATSLSTRAHMEEVRLQKRPVVSIICPNEKDFNFPTRVNNFSMMHAKARFKANIVINGLHLELATGTHYTGDRIWKLQAMGQNGPVFHGHLDIVNTLRRKNMELPAQSELEASVTIDSWVINLYDAEAELFNDENKNPTLHWYWNKRDQKWIPEPSPKN